MRTPLFLMSLACVAALAEEPKAPSLVEALQQAQKNAPADANNAQPAPTPAGANLLKAIEMAKQNQAAAPATGAAADPAKVPAGQDLGALIKAIEEAKKKQAAQQ